MSSVGYQEPVDQLSEKTRDKVLEWIRRMDPRFSKELKDYLFSDRSIARD